MEVPISLVTIVLKERTTDDTVGRGALTPPSEGSLIDRSNRYRCVHIVDIFHVFPTNPSPCGSHDLLLAQILFVQRAVIPSNGNLSQHIFTLFGADSDEIRPRLTVVIVF